MKDQASPNTIGTKFNRDLDARLRREYTQALIDNQYGMSRSQLLKRNMIDMRNIAPTKAATNINAPVTDKSEMPDMSLSRNDSDELLDYFYYESWFNSIPCFDEGVLRVNTSRYIHWKLLDLDITNKTMRISIQDYIRYAYGWQPGCKLDATQEFQANDDKNGYKLIVKTIHSQYTYSDIYTIIDTKTLSWSKSDIDFWNDISVKFSQQSDKKLWDEHQTTTPLELLKSFYFAIIRVNYELSKNKPSKGKTDPADKQKAHAKIEIDTTAPQPKRLIRTVGRLSVKSNTIPRESTRQSVIRYKVASWTTRGGVRHMKSGKLVPYKASIHKRHCLQDSDKMPPPTTLQFRKPKPEKG